MAHYAFLDQDNVVVEVIVGKNENETIDGLDPETWYGRFRNLKCVRTSYNGNIRKNFAAVGYFYDEVNDTFIPPRCHIDCVLDPDNFLWKCLKIVAPE
jgi:hypothetical protein